MITMPVVTKLVMHYAPGFLILLNRVDCPGRTLTWGAHGHRQGHTGCCDKNHHLFYPVHAHMLTTDEISWCLEQCWVDRSRAQAVDKTVEEAMV